MSHDKLHSTLVGLPRCVSKSTFAKVIGVTPGRVSQMITKGLPVEDDGKIDVARGKLWFRENIDQGRAAAQREGDQGELALPLTGAERVTAERVRLVREQADAAALKNATLRGDLIPADDVEREWRAALMAVRAAMLAVPARVEAACPSLPRSALATLDAEIRAALEALADDA